MDRALNSQEDTAGRPKCRGRNEGKTTKRIFVRSVTNFVIGYEWFCSIFKLKMGDLSKMV